MEDTWFLHGTMIMFKTRKDYRFREWPAGKNSPKMKRIASRLVRRMNKRSNEIVPQGMGFKKVFEHYDINDFR